MSLGRCGVLVAGGLSSGSCGESGVVTVVVFSGVLYCSIVMLSVVVEADVAVGGVVVVVVVARRGVEDVSGCSPFSSLNNKHNMIEWRE